MASDTGRELPSPEKVLTSLKSSGIFDEFRKSCMASVELEVSCIGRFSVTHAKGKQHGFPPCI